MIELGKYNDLKIIRTSDDGWVLGDESGAEILLPTKHCPEGFNPGDEVNVFVHHSGEGKMVATSQKPKLTLGEFHLLKVKAIADSVGAFMEWGLDKDLMVPFREQKQRMEDERWYIVYLDVDLETDRLYGSSRIERFLQNEMISVEVGDEVEVLVWKKTEIGYSVILNNIHEGLIFENEIFQELNVGDKLKGFVKKVRKDNKIDVTIHPIGYDNFNDPNVDSLYEALVQNNGFLDVTDKSTPDQIYARFGMSKKAFKRALGALYKQRKVEIQPDKIKLI